MPMVNSKEMFKKAYEGGYAIGAFNVNNMEIIQGITEGAKMENAPLILQVSAGARKYAKHVYLMKMIEAAIEDTDLPIVVHLDHGPDFETCKSCIDGGFTSVMIDGSHLPFEENIALTRKVVEYRRGGRREGVRRGFQLHPPRRGRGVCHPHRVRQPGHRDRHEPRRLQVQGRAQAAL